MSSDIQKLKESIILRAIIQEMFMDILRVEEKSCQTATEIYTQERAPEMVTSR